MGLTGALLEISNKKCPHCRKVYAKHSKKQFMKCLYTANYNLYHIIQEYNKLKKINDESDGSEKKALVKEEEMEDEVIAEKVS